MDGIKLFGKFFITGTITAKTGLHIGGSNIGLEIGGADMVVIRDKVTNQPYIPGSSLKGSMRALLERSGKDNGQGYRMDTVVEKEKEWESIRIHICDNEDEYINCPICNVFGISAGEGEFVTSPTRLKCRDALLRDESTDLKNNPNTDMPYTEVKTEVVIDRITSKATPRQLERVPAGSEFDFEMIYDVYKSKDIDWLCTLFSGMELLEDSYLGGQGSRGSGQIKFGRFERTEDTKEVKFDSPKESVVLYWKPAGYYISDEERVQIGKKSIQQWKDELLEMSEIKEIKNQIKS